MERGSAKHGPRRDDALAAEPEGELGPDGSDPEDPADDDPTSDAADPDAPVSGDGPVDQDEAQMQRLQHDMAVANDWNPTEP